MPAIQLPTFTNQAALDAGKVGDWDNTPCGDKSLANIVG